jgi:DNA-binding transcriptional LysR family regulator
MFRSILQAMLEELGEQLLARRRYRLTPQAHAIVLLDDSQHALDMLHAAGFRFRRVR